MKVWFFWHKRLKFQYRRLVLGMDHRLSRIKSNQQKPSVLKSKALEAQVLQVNSSVAVWQFTVCCYTSNLPGVQTKCETADFSCQAGDSYICPLAESDHGDDSGDDIVMGQDDDDYELADDETDIESDSE